MTPWPERLLGLAGACAGVAGVGLSALAAHSGAGATLDIAARFLLVHAAALVGLTALIVCAGVHLRIARVAGTAMALGLVLFCGDLVCRGLLGVSLLPMAAPGGGILLMAGWGLIGLAVCARAAPPRPTGQAVANSRPSLHLASSQPVACGQPVAPCEPGVSVSPPRAPDPSAPLSRAQHPIDA